MKSLRFAAPTVFFALLAGCALPTLAQADDFEDLRRDSRAVKIDSATQLREDAVIFEGRMVELEGEVSGIMTRQGARTVLLKMGEEMAVLSAPSDIANAGVLRTGVMVRLLVRVTGDNKEAMFVIVSAAESTLPPYARSAKGASAKDKSAPGDSAEIVVPLSATVEILPEAPDTTFGNSAQPNPKVVIIKGTRVTTPAKTKPVAKTTNAKSSNAKNINKNAGQLPANKPTPGELEDLIASQVPAYSAIVRKHNSKLKPEVVEEISVALLRAGYKHNMDPRFIASIIAVESNFNVMSRSRSGAMGLGQMMPFNLKEAGVKDPWNPTQNVMGTAQLLRNLLDSYKNRADGTLLAVAAYNAGSGAVRRAGYKVPNGSQVQRYVWKVYNRYKAFAPDMFD